MGMYAYVPCKIETYRDTFPYLFSLFHVHIRHENVHFRYLYLNMLLLMILIGIFDVKLLPYDTSGKRLPTSSGYVVIVRYHYIFYK